MIYRLNENVDFEPITFNQAVHLMQPKDTFELTFQKEVSRYGFTIFEPGKVYKGSEVLPNGSISVKHEDVFVRGDTSTFTKEEFIEELSEEGEPCDLLDCDKSIFIRPGEGQKSFADALQNPTFGPEQAEDEQETQPLPRPDQQAEEEPSEITPPKNLNIHIKPSTPNLRIEKTQNGQHIISYGSDPLGGKDHFAKIPIEGELQRLFGYNDWEEYKRDNFEDLTRTTEKDNQGNVVSAATVHPFHVAYAYEEFVNNFDPEEYELVGVPKSNAGNIKPSNISLVTLVSGLRRGFFGSSVGDNDLGRVGVLNAAIYNPREGLLNKGIIDRIKEKSGVASKVKQVFTNAMFVHHPNSDFWRLDLKEPYITNKRSEALNVKPSEAASDLAILNEARTGRVLHVHTESYLDNLSEAWGFLPGLARFTRPLWGPALKGIKHGWKSLTRPASHTWRSRGALATGASGPIKQFTRPGYKAAAARAARVSKLRWNSWSWPEKTAHIAVRIYKPIEDLVVGAVKMGLSWPAFVGWFVYESYIEPGHADWIVKWGEERGYWEADDPDLLELIEDKMNNLTDEEKKDLILNLPAGQGGDGQKGTIETVTDLNFYLLPKTWKTGGFLTKAEETLAKRVGANYSSGLMISPTGQSALLNFKKDFAKKSKIKGSAALQNPIKQKTPNATITPSSILVFGHSQTGRFGEAISNQAKASGIEVTKIVKSGKSDHGLQKVLGEIPKKNYSHAFLFLGGNTVAKGPDYEGPKAGIINHMVSTLKIPKQNIIVSMPPVNLDNKYSKSRIPLNKRAEGIFNSLGVKVLPQVIGNAGDFSKDGYHIKASSPLTVAAAGDMLTSFTASPDLPTAPAERAVATPGSKAEVAQIVVDEARKAGVDPLFALTVARIESNFNPLSNMNKKTRYKGLYQFGSHYKDEWQTKYGLDWSRVHDARHAAGAFMNAIKYFVGTLRSRGILKSSTASNVNPEEAYLIYLAWQQGIHGTTTIVKADRAGTSVPDNIQRNMDNNTYPKTPNISPGDFLDMWSRKTKGFMNGVRGKYAQALSSASPQIAETLDYLLEEIKYIEKGIEL